MVNQAVHEAVRDALIKGIQANGYDIFYRSQDTLGCY